MLKFYLLLALLASLFVGCGSYEEVNSFFAERCGNDYYDVEKQFCRNSEIYEKCGGSIYDPLSQKCENNNLFSKCGNYYYNVAKQFCKNSVIYNKCGGSSYDPLNQKCENNVVFSKCGDGWYNPISEFCSGNDGVIIESKGEFIDGRDNRTYKYVAIGTQMWMAENLRYETSNTKCYDNDPENCRIFGILYDWNTARVICPSGWHLPDDTEWLTLRHFATDTKLMANSSLWLYNIGTDDFGFTALPGGHYRYEGYFLTIYEEAIFWSATTGSAEGSAHVHILTYKSGIKEIGGLYTDNSWANVRCIKD